MELAFLTLLLKDGAESISGGIEQVIETWLTKDGGGANGIDKGIKCGFVFICPMEFAPLCAMGHKCIEWGSKHAEIVDIHAIEVEKAQERA